MAYNVLMCH